MRKTLTYLVTGVLLLALLAYACTFTVRFTEAAVVTTLGRATADDVVTTPGLRFKLPYFQSVTKYSTQVRVLATQLETLQTADNRQVVVESFCLWRVSDPLKFFQRFGNAGYTSEEHYREAEKALRANMRSAGGQISRYRMDELFSATQTDQGGALARLETQMREAFASSADQSGLKLSDYGIAAVDVGLMRIVLPEETTKSVFERMKTSRERLAQETDSRGNAQAQAIKARAESDAKKITDFANRLAQEIRNRGEIEAAPYLRKMQTNAELAVFLENMDFIRESYGKRTTLVLSGSMPGINMIFPDSLDRLRAGQVPAPVSTNWLTDTMSPRPAPAAQPAEERP
ncbi:MAG: hypothetical protein KF859_09505 [Phycisphaeraceae bacterium]|nr:hypothetical protein [Phycisphaeraceae bacterium]